MKTPSSSRSSSQSSSAAPAAAAPGLSATLRAMQRSAPLAGQVFLSAGFEQWQRWQASLLAANSWWLYYSPLATGGRQENLKGEAKPKEGADAVAPAHSPASLEPLAALAPVAPLLGAAQRLWGLQMHTIALLQGTARVTHEAQLSKLGSAQSEMHATLVQGLHRLANPRSNTLAPALRR